MHSGDPEVEVLHTLAELLIADRSPRNGLATASPQVVAMVEIAQLIRGWQSVPPAPGFVAALFRHTVGWHTMGTEEVPAG